MSYRTRDTLISLFRELASDYPDIVTEEVFAKSTQGRNMWVFKIGDSRGGTVMMDAMIHGKELLNAEILWLYAQWLARKKEPAAERILKRNCTLIVPIYNIDNYMITRKNANGVDLNRNHEAGWGGSCANEDPAHWGYKGTAPASELETKAIDSLFLKYKPKWYITMHTGQSPLFYRAGGSSQTERDYVTAVHTKYKALATQRGVVKHSLSTSGYCGMSHSQASVKRGAHSLLWEIHERENTPPPAFSEVEPIYLPMFLPLAITVSEDCGIDLPPIEMPPVTYSVLSLSLSLFSVVWVNLVVTNSLSKLRGG